MFNPLFNLAGVESWVQAAMPQDLGQDLGQAWGQGFGTDIAQGMIQGLVRGLVWGIRWLQQIPTQALAVAAWAIALLALWQLFSAGRDTVQRSQEMHRIPCANCEFFTNDHRLKCPVHPHKALTEEAVNCQDFETARNF